MNLLTEVNRFEYVNKESIDEDLICSICANPFTSPVSTTCLPKSHTFCRNCIESWIKTNSSCPTCNQKAHIKHLSPIVTVNFINMLNKILVKCLACKQVEMKRTDFDVHYNEQCPDVVVQCPSSDCECSWIGTRDQLEDHLKICIINLIKPLFAACLNEADQLQIENEKLRNENKQLKSKAPRQRTSLLGSVKTTQPLSAKLNNQQTQVTEPAKADTQYKLEIIAEKFVTVLSKVNEQRIENAKENKQLNDRLNQVQLQYTVLQKKYSELRSQREQMLKTIPKKIRNPPSNECSHRTHTNNHDARTSSTVHHSVPNLPVDISGNGQSILHNYFNGQPYANVNNNLPNDIAQNMFNHPGIEPFSIPISISISINTNIAEGNANNNAGCTNNNITGGNNVSICAGNANIGDGSQNNVAGGDRNKIASRNNYVYDDNNNDTVDRNNNFTRHNNDGGGDGINNADGSNHNASNRVNNAGANLNNRASNNITGNGNNIAGGNNNNIISGILNVGGTSTNTAGGSHNYIAAGDNSFHAMDNNQNGFNNAPDDGDGSENGTNNLVAYPIDDFRSETSSINGRLRENPDEVHPPDVNNR